MVKHYVKFSPAAAEHARQLFAGELDPIQSAFDDLTARGQRIRFRGRAPTADGPCVEVAGSRCFALLGVDRRQQGVLFAFSVRESAFPNGIADEASDYLASFQLWHSSLVSADSVDAIFTSQVLAPPARLVHSHSPGQPRARIVPSTDLRAYFATVPKEVRVLYWPVSPAKTPVAAHVAHACRTWRKHGLDGLSLPTKGSWQESVLRGSASMSPSRQNSEALWPLFDVLLLERFVASVHGAAASETRFHALVQDIATLPLSEAQRARLWFHLIIQRDADSLVQDVAALAPALASLSPQMQDTWERYIDDAVRDISSRFSSHDLLLLLKTRIDLANAQDLQIGTVLVDWARVITNPSLATHLQPSDVKVEASASPPTVATLTPPTVPAADAVPTDALERWVLSTLGSDEEAVSALRREARFLLSTISEVLESPATMVLMKLSEQAELAQQAISHWRVLPPADRIIRQRSACIHAYSKAKSAVSSGVLDGLLLTGIEPDALVELIDLVEQAHIWNAMPQWWWVALTSDTTTGPGSGKASDTWIRAFSQTQNRRLARCNRSRGDSGRQASSQVRG